MGPTVGWSAHNGRAVGMSTEAAKEGTAGVEVRMFDTSSSRPGASVSRFPAHRYALPTVARRGSRSLGCAALHMFRPEQDGKLASILRTSNAQLSRSGSQPEGPKRTINAQIGVQPAIIDVQLDGQIGS